MKNILLIIALLIVQSCTNIGFNNKSTDSFKVIGYYASWNGPVENLSMAGLTHIIYSFAIPAKTGNVLQPIKDEKKLQLLVDSGHKNGVKIFLAIGGWDIEDGGGKDQRFHEIMQSAETRSIFVKSIMQFVKYYDIDGIDFDWEYPDENSSSADNYVDFMKELSDSLHTENKQLSAAVVSYGAKGYGIKSEVFPFLDWLNIMAYDENNEDTTRPHSPYKLAEKSLNYWINERKLPTKKAILGLPFYGMPSPMDRNTDYNALILSGANPILDEIDGIFYNGITTIKNKTKLALKRNCGGVMIWEISADTKDKTSLVKAINEIKLEEN